MLAKKVLFLLLILCVLVLQSSSQSSPFADSILNTIRHSSRETNFDQHLILSKEYAKIGNYEETFNYAIAAKNVAEKSGQSVKKAKAYYELGLRYYRWDQSTESIKFLNKGLLVPNGLDAAQRINSYVVIGINHSVHDENQEAIIYYHQALPLSKEANLISKRDYNFIYNNLAISFMEVGNFDSSLFYHERCLDHRILAKNKYGQGQSYNNIGSLAYAQGRFESALENFKKGLDFRLNAERFSWSGVYESKINIGKALLALNRFSEAETILSMTYDSAHFKGNFSLEIRASEQLKNLYAKTGNYEDAFNFNTIYHNIKDSMYGIGQKGEIIRLNHVNKYEEKLLQDSLQREETRKLTAIEDEQKERVNFIILISLAGAVLFLFGIVVLIYRNLRAKKKSTIIILKQKEEVDKQRKIALNQKDMLAERNKEITDSIEYAERIQKAILPTESIFNAHIKDGFVYYKPKDIVAGDFYWLETIDEYTFLAVADCTGHGVPGALVSVVCNNALNRSTREFGLRSVASILDKTRELVIETFAKSEEEVK
ncbi:MAG: tetratricopeptide repeat protein, partial [Flavobacteriales bacterium]|nr:tetratricopeptide repeat protein [Flavobacteriales bacterium]